MKDKSPTNRDNERTVKTMKLIYVAHKFGGDLRNADRADRLTAERNLRINGAVFICPWLPMVRRCVGIDLDPAAVAEATARVEAEERFSHMGTEKRGHGGLFT